jgi:hypothetical protein
MGMATIYWDMHMKYVNTANLKYFGNKRVKVLCTVKIKNLLLTE